MIVRYIILILNVWCVFYSLQVCAIDVKSNLIFQSQGFIENRGQICDQNNIPQQDVKYVYNGNPYKIILRSTGFSYQVQSESKECFSEATGLICKAKDKQTYINTHRIDISFKGANPNSTIEPTNKTHGYINYYNYKSSAVHINSYENILFKKIYPNIDIVFMIKNGQFKYDFILHPGAHLEDIQMLYQGMDVLNLETDGALKMRTTFGILSEQIPLSYQKENNKKITVAYQIKGNVVSFKTQKYDKRSTLIIDPVPVLKWGRFFSDEGTTSYAVSVDGNDNSIITGSAASTNLATTGAYKNFLSGNSDAFIAKFGPTGELLWATYYGGSGIDEAEDITIDSKGSIIVTGYTNSDGISTSGAFRQNNENYDAFICKLDPNGAMVWSTYFGGEDFDQAYGVCVDAEDNIIVVGQTYSIGGIATLNAFQTSKQFGSIVGFITKFDHLGQRQWATYFGGNTTTQCYKVATNSKNNYIIYGSTTNGELGTQGVYRSTIGGKADAFIAQFDTTGNRIWCTYYGGSEDENSTGIGNATGGLTIDHNDNIIITGATRSRDNIATLGAFKNFNSGSVDFSSNNLGNDCYLAKFTSNGSISWSTYYGGNNLDYGTGVAVDSNSNIYFSGVTTSKENIATKCSIQDSLSKSVFYGNAFLAKFSSVGSRLWGSYMGNYGDNVASGLAVNSQNKVIITGYEYDILQGNLPDIISPEFLNTFKRYSSFLISLDERNLIAPKITNTGSTFICEGSSVSIDADAGFTYKWITGETTQSINVSQEGNYYVLGTDMYGCQMKSNEINITYIRPVITTSTSSDKFCSGDNITLSSSPAASYSWSTGETTQSIVINQSGQYYVGATDANGCIGKSYTKNISEVYSPSVYLGKDTILCNGATKILSLYIPNATYVWTDGSTLPSYTVTKPGVYSVAVTVSPCPAVESNIKIQYISEINYNIPNLITANEDGYNECFEIEQLLPNTFVEIYNSYGALVYRNHNYMNDWCPDKIDGVYYYYISNPNQCVKDYKDWVQVIK
jgi:hypothetical protein